MMIADQVNALNRAREVAAVANLIRLAAASQQSVAAIVQQQQPSPKMKSDSENERVTPEVEDDSNSNSIEDVPSPANNNKPSPAPSPVAPPTTQQVKRISFSVDSLLSDVRRSTQPEIQPQHQAADLSVRSQHSEEEDKSLIDSAEEADVDEDDEDVDIEEDGASEASDSSPTREHKISRPSPTLAASLFHPPHLMAHPHFQHVQAMQMRSPFSAGPAPPGWPLPYGLAAAAWAQHASQFVGSKLNNSTHSSTPDSNRERARALSTRKPYGILMMGLKLLFGV